MDGRGWLFEFFIAEGKKFKRYVQNKIQGATEMDAEDIVSDVMLKMISRSDELFSVENIAAYAYRSLRNKIIDYAREPKNVSLQSQIDEDEELSFMDILADQNFDVSKEAQKKEFVKRLHEALESIHPLQRSVFIATEIHGLSFKELSERLQTPIGTLLSRKSRAVKALQEKLKDFKNQ